MLLQRRAKAQQEIEMDIKNCNYFQFDYNAVFLLFGFERMKMFL